MVNPWGPAKGGGGCNAHQQAPKSISSGGTRQCILFRSQPILFLAVESIATNARGTTKAKIWFSSAIRKCKGNGAPSGAGANTSLSQPIGRRQSPPPSPPPPPWWRLLDANNKLSSSRLTDETCSQFRWRNQHGDDVLRPAALCLVWFSYGTFPPPPSYTINVRTFCTSWMSQHTTCGSNMIKSNPSCVMTTWELYNVILIESPLKRLSFLLHDVASTLNIGKHEAVRLANWPVIVLQVKWL